MERVYISGMTRLLPNGLGYASEVNRNVIRNDTAKIVRQVPAQPIHACKMDTLSP
jgi:hypothetical protein